jgi:hypothetical protein
MHYRTLGNSGVVVSTFALGTMTFGAETDETTSHAILGDYVAAGGRPRRGSLRGFRKHVALLRVEYAPPDPADRISYRLRDQARATCGYRRWRSRRCGSAKSRPLWEWII